MTILLLRSTIKSSVVAAKVGNVMIYDCNKNDDAGKSVHTSARVAQAGRVVLPFVGHPHIRCALLRCALLRYALLYER